MAERTDTPEKKPPRAKTQPDQPHASEATADQPKESGQKSSWIREHTAAALTLMGLAFYAGTLLAYSQFYGYFGIEPEEAGVNYTTALARGGPAFLSWLSSIVVLSIFAALIAWGIVALWRHLGVGTDAAAAAADESADQAVGADEADKETDGDWPELVTLVIRHPIAVTLGVLGVSGILFIYVAVADSTALAKSVKDGKDVRPSVLFPELRLNLPRNDFWRNPLRLRVENVSVSPAAGQSRLPADLRPKKKDHPRVFAYLGRSGDTIVLYDPRESKTLRIPATQISVSRANP
jgi:hypothetical protein